LPFFSSTFYAQTKHPADTDAHTLTHKHKHKQREPLQRLARNQRLKLCPLCQCHHTVIILPSFVSLRLGKQWGSYLFCLLSSHQHLML